MNNSNIEYIDRAIKTNCNLAGAYIYVNHFGDLMDSYPGKSHNIYIDFFGIVYIPDIENYLIFVLSNDMNSTFGDYECVIVR